MIYLSYFRNNIAYTRLTAAFQCTVYPRNGFLTELPSDTSFKAVVLRLITIDYDICRRLCPFLNDGYIVVTWVNISETAWALPKYSAKYSPCSTGSTVQKENFAANKSSISVKFSPYSIIPIANFAVNPYSTGCVLFFFFLINFWLNHLIFPYYSVMP